MNIGLFTDSYFPEISGLATSISTLQKELKKRGHNVYIFTTTNPNVEKKIPGVFRLPSMPFIFFKSRRLGVFYMPRAAKCVKRLKLDIVHTQTEFGLGIFGKIMAKQLEIPIVHTFHTMYEDYAHYISKGKFKKLSKDIVRVYFGKYCNSCDSVIAPTRKVWDLLTEYGVETPIKIIPTGIDLSRFHKENFDRGEILAIRKSYGLEEDTPVILFLGRVAKEKSIDVILNQLPKVFKTLPKARFMVVGDGPYTEGLKELAEALGIRDKIIFAGEKSWEEIGKYYRLGDVFVSSSVTETQGLTLIEAMASDVPVVTKKDRNIESFIQNGVNGRVFTKDSELPDILIEILNNRELAESLVCNAYQTVEEYSSDNFGKRIEQLYMQVLKDNIKVKKKDNSGYKRFKSLRSIKRLKNLHL